MTLKITREEQHNTFTVRIEDRYQDRLTFDEALGVAAKFVLGNDPPYLQNAAEHKKWEEWLNRPRASEGEISF